MSGTVGNVVLSSTNGKNVVRSKAFNQKDANSEAQQMHRNVFKKTCDEYTSLSPFIADGFPSRPQSQSCYNAFMAANLSNAVDKSGEFPVFDYSKMILSKGSLQPVEVLEASITQEGIQVNYQPLSENGGAKADDVVIAILKTVEGRVLSVKKPRGQSEEDSILFQVSNASAERILYMYMMVISADKTKASKSVYVSIA